MYDAKDVIDRGRDSKVQRCRPRSFKTGSHL